QALGQADRQDERTDVFGLGAMLCEVLTGLPPYAVGNPHQRLQQAAAGDLAGALGRLDRCGADGEVVALAKRCLSPEREGRPANAGAVADALAEYRRRVRERLRRAERRWLVMGLVAAALCLVAGVALAGWWLQRGRAERAAEEARRLGGV